MNVRRGDVEIKQHSGVTYLGSVLDENLSGESMATKMFGKINSKRIPVQKTKLSGFPPSQVALKCSNSTSFLIMLVPHGTQS